MRFLFFSVLLVAAFAMWRVARRQHLGGGVVAGLLGIMGLLAAAGRDVASSPPSAPVTSASSMSSGTCGPRP